MTQHMTPPFESNRLAENELKQIDAYWRAANYLSVGQIYLLDNPLLREPLAARARQAAPARPLGHDAGLNFIYAHLNRVIRTRDADMIYVCGPGHGGPAMVANTYLEGTYSELYPDITLDEAGMRKLFRQFSFPGGIPSHAAPESPGSIHEGGELGYALSHAYGAAFDNPDLIVACVVGDGEAETGPLAAAWHSNKFLNPARRRRGAADPASQRLQDRQSDGAGAHPRRGAARALRRLWLRAAFVEGDEPAPMHERMADALDDAIERIRAIQDAARDGRRASRPPELADDRAAQPEGLDRTEGGRRAQDRRVLALAPGAARRASRKTRSISSCSRTGCGATGRKNCSTQTALLSPSIRATRRRARGAWAPTRTPMAACCASLELPGLARLRRRGAAARVRRRPKRPGRWATSCATSCSLNDEARNFRIIGPDETASNRLQAVFEVTERVWMETILPDDVHLGRDGRVMEVLCEHLCQGWLEGYLLTGRHGLFSCYEAFIHIVDSMFNQHAKWLNACRDIPWRRPIASLNYLLTRMSGVRTTMASAIRIRASSISSPTRRPTSSASTFRRTPTRCSGSPIIACAPRTASTSSSPASSRRRNG